MASSLICVALAAAGGGCGPLGDEIDGSHAGLADAVRRSGDTGTPFRLASVADFAWDRVYVFEPYSPPERINRDLGFDWDGADDGAIRDADWINLVVFVRDGEVVRAFEQDLGDGDLGCLDGRHTGRNGLAREEAVLRAERRPAGQGPEYTVVLARPETEREKRLTRRCLRLAS